jgi:hydroxymethylpyrimidine kinase/phosphomethylpyrimidine kinase
MKKVLTIAGSDSGGGAGIQADLKTFTAFGVFGTSVITAVTAQNTIGVQGILEIPAEFVGRQIDSVMQDIGADSVKIGMLANTEVIEVVADRIRKYKMKLVVLDPVMVAKSGDRLLNMDSQKALIEKLFPLPYLITPNLAEAEIITGLKIKNVEQMVEAAKKILKMGPKNVLVKGGHLQGEQDAIDILVTNEEKIYRFISKRIKTKNTHGTGCTYSSAIVAELAKGNDLVKSIKSAKKYIDCTIKGGQFLQIGHGHGPLNHMAK